MADNLLQTLINSLDDLSEKPTEMERWDKLITSKDWRNPLKYGELTPDGFIAAFNRHPYSDWPKHATMYVPLFKALKANTSDVLRMIKTVSHHDPYWRDRSNVLYLDMYKSYLEANNLPLTTKSLADYTDLIPIQITAENRMAFIETVAFFAQTPEDKKQVKNYLINRFETMLIESAHRNQQSVNTTYPGSFALIEHFIPDIDTQHVIKASQKTMDVTSQLHLVFKDKYSIVDLLDNLIKTNPKVLLNLSLLEDLTVACNNLAPETIASIKWPADFSKRIASVLPDEDFDTKHLRLITILSYLGVDTKDLESKIYPSLLNTAHYINADYGSKIFSDPKQKEVMKAWLQIEFNYNKNLSNASNSLSDDEIVAILKDSPWFPAKLTEVKDKVDHDNLIKYVAAVDPNDMNWPSLAGKLVRLVQTSRINSRSTIKKLKDLGFKIPGPVSRDFTDIDALVYALTGLKSDSLRTAATALGIKTSSEEYATMVVEHIRSVKHPETNQAIALPMLDVSV